MDKNLIRLSAVLAAILLTLCLTCAARTWLFIQAENNWHAETFTSSNRYTFTTFSSTVTLPALFENNASRNVEFTTGIYNVRKYECLLHINTRHQAADYWWFLDPTVNKIAVLPAPVVMGYALTPSLVYPDVLTWYIEPQRQIYDALKEALGSDQAVQAMAESCKVKPASYIF